MLYSRFPQEESKEGFLFLEDSASMISDPPFGLGKMGRLNTLGSLQGSRGTSGAIFVENSKKKLLKGLTLTRQNSLDKTRQISLETKFVHSLPRKQIHQVQKRFTRLFLRKLLAKAYHAFDKLQ